ncbi:MAG: oxidoreductase [Polaromonas sp.]|uniref:PDR/VanB family oxidoreductase n=1 Tax=Polaromonas sp. TaxID=1869339 RepID=UPI0025CC66E9|nr:PDR/VanB family oxidoreductase [Polaromonas sp.]MBI2726104.1 oxidoreductase [Polaromonas sp.]
MPKKEHIAVVVSAVTQLTPRIREYLLAAGDGRPLPAYEAGSHIEVLINPEGIGETVRHYSLIGGTETIDDGRSAYRIAVQREDRARGSAHIHHTLEVGSQLAISAPKNEFRLDHRDSKSLLIAGGIGITPIFAMLRSLVQRRRPFGMAYTGRSRGEMAYVDAVQRLAGPHAHIHCNDEGGLLDVKALLAAQPAHTSAYVCGPAALIDAVRHAAAELGWDTQRVRSELFTPPPTGDEVAFDVVLKQSGQTIRVGANTSILDALKNAGQHPLFDCRRGECGLCPLGILEADGPITHRDRYLSDAEKASGKTLCVCVSRLQGSRLVLDA